MKKIQKKNKAFQISHPFNESPTYIMIFVFNASCNGADFVCQRWQS